MNNLETTTHKLESRKERIEKLSNLYATIAGLIGVAADFLSPVIPFQYAFYVAGGVTAILYAGKINSKLGDNYQKFLGEWWHQPAITTALLATLAVGLNTYGTSEHKEEGGWMASLIPGISELQHHFGVVEEKLTDIAENTKQTADNTAKIADSSKKISDTVKKETSEDPRKELANLGIGWSEERFLRSIKNGDTQTVHLFLKGGMPIEADADGIPSIVSIAQIRINHQKMLKLLTEYGFDPYKAYQSNNKGGPSSYFLVPLAMVYSNDELLQSLDIKPETVFDWFGDSKELLDALVDHKSYLSSIKALESMNANEQSIIDLKEQLTEVAKKINQIKTEPYSKIIENRGEGFSKAKFTIEKLKEDIEKRK